MPKRLDIKDPEESVLMEFDFSDAAASVSLIECKAEAVRNVDDNANAILDADAVDNSVNGAKVFQRIHGGLDKVNYGVECKVLTDTGDILLLAAIVPVRRKINGRSYGCNY